MTDFVKGFREVVQDLLVPELKAIQVELKHLSGRMDSIEKRFETMQEHIQTLIIGQREILAKLDLDKRVSRIEVLLEELRKQKATV